MPKLHGRTVAAPDETVLLTRKLKTPTRQHTCKDAITRARTSHKQIEERGATRRSMHPSIRPSVFCCLGCVGCCRCAAVDGWCWAAVIQLRELGPRMCKSALRSVVDVRLSSFHTNKIAGIRNISQQSRKTSISPRNEIEIAPNIF